MKDKHNLFYIDIVRNPIDKSIPKKINHYSCEHYTEIYVDEGVILGLISGGQTDMEILISNEDTEVYVMNINGKTLNILTGKRSTAKVRDYENLQNMLILIGIEVHISEIADWSDEEYGQAEQYANSRICPAFLDKFKSK